MDVVSDDWGVLGVVVLDEGVDLVAALHGGTAWRLCCSMSILFTFIASTLEL